MVQRHAAVIATVFAIGLLCLPLPDLHPAPGAWAEARAKPIIPPVPAIPPVPTTPQTPPLQPVPPIPRLPTVPPIPLGPSR